MKMQTFTKGSSEQALSVCIAPVADSNHIYCSLRIVNRIDYPIITNANSPNANSVFKFTTATWTRDTRQLCDTRVYALKDTRGKFCQFFAG